MKKNAIAYFFITPTIVLLIVFKLYPIIISVIGSLFSSGQGGIKEFVAFQNYVSLFLDPVFWKSLQVTAIFNLFVNPIQIIAALVLAILVNQKIKGINFFRSIIYTPVSVSLAVASILWGIMLNPNSGLANSLLGILHIPNQPFLTSTHQSLLVIIIIASWKGIAYWMMFLLAGLQGISESIYESANIDGSSKMNTVFKITIPLLKGPLAFVTVADTIANILLFAPMYILTDGGPQMSTHVLMYEAFMSSFKYSNVGRSYAITTILLLIVAGVVSIQLKLLKADH